MGNSARAIKYTREDMLDLAAYLEDSSMGTVTEASGNITSHKISLVGSMTELLKHHSKKQAMRMLHRETRPPGKLAEKVCQLMLRALFRTPLEDLPELIGHDYFDVRKAAEWRLKRGI